VRRKFAVVLSASALIMQAIRLPHRHARGFQSSQKSCLKCLGPQTRLSRCPKPKRTSPIHSALPSDSEHGPECDPRRPSGVSGLPAGLARPALSVFTLAFCTVSIDCPSLLSKLCDKCSVSKTFVFITSADEFLCR